MNTDSIVAENRPLEVKLTSTIASKSTANSIPKKI